MEEEKGAELHTYRFLDYLAKEAEEASDTLLYELIDTKFYISVWE